MNILVTGGAGFIGSHLVDAWLSRGATVFVIDDLSTGSRRNVARWEGDDRVHFAEGRVEDVDVLDAWAERADHIFHMAAAVGVRLVVEQRVHAIETNLEATAAVLRAARRSDASVFVASTSEVYGKSGRLPYQETSPLVIGSPDVGRWSYACSKAMGEFLALAHAAETELPVVIGRLFNTTGPRQRGTYGMVLPTFVRQALRGETITVFGDGEQTRCFAHVADVVGAISTLVETPAAYGEVFNIGNDEEVSILELAERVLAQTGSTSEIERIPYEQVYAQEFEDMRRRIPDLAKLRQTIGYRPQHDLDAIVASVVAFERERLQDAS